MKMLTAVDMLMPMESQNFSKSFFKSASTRKGFRVGSHLMIQSRYVFASRVSLSDESPVFFDSRFLVDGPSIDGVLGAFLNRGVGYILDGRVFPQRNGLAVVTVIVDGVLGRSLQLVFRRGLLF